MPTIVNDGLSEPMYHAIVRWHGKYKRTGYLSTTSCINPPRARVLEARHDSQIIIMASSLMDPFIGSACHDAIDGAMLEAMHEEEFVTEVAGIKFSGRPDVIYHSDTGALESGDFKFTRVDSYIFNGGKIKEEHERQAQINAWLAGLNSFNIERAWVELVFVDWKRTEAQYDRLYPPRAVRLYPTLISAEEVSAYVTERVGLHLAADKLPDDELPKCSASEQWAKPDAWAVIKDGGSRAVNGGIKSTELEAKRLLREKGGGYEIQYRQGRKVRCEMFCNAKPFCNQYMEELLAKKSAK